MLQLNSELNLFNSLLYEKIKQGEELLNEKINDPDIIRQKTKDWQEESIKFLETNINEFPESLISKIRYVSDGNLLSEYLGKKELEKNAIKHVNYLSAQLEKKIIELKKCADYIAISEIINKNKKPELNKIEEKIDFVLQKLNLLFNDNYYSISMIFKFNAIKYRDREPEEIAENLKRRGYGVRNESWPANDALKISVKGAAFIERKNKASKKKEKTKAESEINSKIDSVLSKLDDLGYGQEIIFNEIEELRNLSKKLSKKTWSQLVKGKMVDLVISEVINKNVATYIYEALVEDKFKLLK
jgi:hypothetical protein